MTKMMCVLAAGVAVCSASALYAIEWGADNVAVLDVAGATETLSGSQALKGVKVTAANVTLAAEDGAMLALGAGGFTNTAAGTIRRTAAPAIPARRSRRRSARGRRRAAWS